MSIETIVTDLATPSRWVEAWKDADPNDRWIAGFSLLLVFNVYRSIFQQYRDSRSTSAIYAVATGGIASMFLKMGYTFSFLDYAAECLGFVILTAIGPGKRQPGDKKNASSPSP